VLNVNRESMARFGFSPPTRMFEAAGAGALIITDYWAGIDLFLEPQQECLVARNGAEVAAMMERVSLSEARRIGQEARRRVLAEHTYAHRAAQVHALLGEQRGKRTVEAAG
jgi:spore maturation protein CgeB